MRRGYYRRQRQRIGQRGAINRPVPPPDASCPGPPSAPPAPRRDWPAISSAHPGWWQVHRVEVRGGARGFALIAEVRTEAEAFQVAATQASQVRITKWGDRQRPYFSPQRPRMLADEPV
jgi:hypothetical protein